MGKQLIDGAEIMERKHRAFFFTTTRIHERLPERRLDFIWDLAFHSLTDPLAFRCRILPAPLSSSSGRSPSLLTK